MVVLGRGRLGTSLAGALGVELRAGRNRAGSPGFPAGAIVFLAAPDQVLGPLAQELAEERHPQPAAFVHLSGTLGLEVMEPLRGVGHAVGSFHPLQSFPTARPPAAFKGSLVAIEASEPALERRLTALAHVLGARPRLVPTTQRGLYHAAAVLASNYLVALAAQAAEVLVAAGWSRQDALDALIPLMSGVLGSLSAQGLPNALIGPIRRGDAATVVQHLEALSQLAAAGRSTPLRLYLVLGEAALALAREAGLDATAAQRIAEALTPSGSDQEVTEP